jgi:hypothetical protein
VLHPVFVPGNEDVTEVMTSIRDKADDLSGFGWVQAPAYNPGIIGGEFRGNKKTAQLMSSFLRAIPALVCAVEPYTDTKIRYHFSHFKMMNSQRIMCFEEVPYQCPVSKDTGKPIEPTEL